MTTNYIIQNKSSQPVLSCQSHPHQRVMPETYWLPGFELSKQVVLSQIRFMLGPTASARPYSHQGSDGFMITGSRLTEVSDMDLSDRNFDLTLSKAQIVDLKRQSREHERQRARRMTNGQDEPNIHGLVVIRARRRSPDNSRSRHYR